MDVGGRHSAAQAKHAYMAKLHMQMLTLVHIKRAYGATLS
jgi:hypothetical protein